MKTKTKKIILAVIVILILAGFIGYRSYTKVYNQSNVKQDTEIGSNIEKLSIETVVSDMYDFPNRFAGTKSNAIAVQYIRNYFRESGLEPYEGDSYYQSFASEYLKCSRYYMIPVHGTVENVVGRIQGEDSNKAIVISAHMDSYLGKGVIDNASGTAALLEVAKRLARQLQEGEYPVDIIFASFNAEECGLIGSSAFYEDVSNRYAEFYNINMDCVGALDKPLAVKNLYENSAELYRDFIPYLEKHQIPYKDIVYAADEDGEPLGASDNEVFQENGHAAIILGEDAVRGITNTKKDKELSILDFPELDRLADAVEDFVLTTAGKIY